MESEALSVFMKFNLESEFNALGVLKCFAKSILIILALPFLRSTISNTVHHFLYIEDETVKFLP